MERKKKNACVKSSCGMDRSHPDHTKVLNRLSRAAGQIRGVAQMIEDRRYCVDILTQLKAAQSALRNVEAEVMQAHLRGCIQDAFTTKDPKNMEKKIAELIKLMTS